MTVEIPLSGRLGAGKVALIDEADLPLVSGSTWHLSSRGYARAKIGNRNTSMHRLIVAPPSDKQVDHINGDRLDNRRPNLRVVTHAQNMRNSRPNQGRTTKGAYWRARRGKWEAAIKADNQTIYLGMYESEAEALAAYDDASLRYHGEHGRRNAS